jgi:hypothetical protein
MLGKNLKADSRIPGLSYRGTPLACTADFSVSQLRKIQLRGGFAGAPASSLIIGLATRDQSGLVAGHGWRCKAANYSQFIIFTQHNESPRDALVAASRVPSLA